MYDDDDDPNETCQFRMKFRHGIDKFYQPNSGLRGSKTWDEAIYTYIYTYIYNRCLRAKTRAEASPRAVVTRPESMGAFVPRIKGSRVRLRVVANQMAWSPKNMEANQLLSRLILRRKLLCLTPIARNGEIQAPVASIPRNTGRYNDIPLILGDTPQKKPGRSMMFRSRYDN